jgi:hypothetical protein
MTNGAAILAMPRGHDFRAADEDGMIRQFLGTALRYLLTPREIGSLKRTDEQTMRMIGVSRKELDRMIVGVKGISGK